MKIAVLGAGAMGSIYGGHLSLHNDVYMIDKKQEIVDKINADGLKLFENDKDVIYRPEAMTDSANLGEVDLVILFVKALFSKAALEENRHIIGEHTYVMTLQNGAGHEDILSEFVPKERIIIGTTEDNGAVLDFGYVEEAEKERLISECSYLTVTECLERLRKALIHVDLIHTFMIISSSLYGISSLQMCLFQLLQVFFRFQSVLLQQMNMHGA